MKRKLSFLLVIFVALTVALTGCGKNYAANEAVYVYNWGDYIDESILKDFEKETGIKVIYETFATNEEMYQKIAKGGGKYDVIMPSDYMISKMITEGLLEELDYNNIPNFANIDEKFLGKDFDPNNAYSVPYMWGTLGIMYNKTMVDGTIDSWEAMWDSKYDRKILMVDSQRDAIAVALDKLNYSINSTNPQELEAAKQELIKQKPLVLSYVGDEGKDMMINNEAAMMVAWSGDAMYMKGMNEDLEYVVPKEGSNLWFDNVCIPKGSVNKEAAEKFIDYLCKPEVALKNVEYIGYSTPNKETFKILSDEIKNDPTAYPSDEVVNKGEVFIDLGDFLVDYDKAWTEIKSE